MQLSKQFRWLLIVSLAILYFVLLSLSFSTPISAQSQPAITPTTTATAELIEPLTLDSLGGGGCIKSSPNGTPTGTPEAVCCISGMVYFNGEPVEGAEITIASSHGRVTVYSYVHLGTEQRPYYNQQLSEPPLNVLPGEVVTLTASYSGYTSTITHTAQPLGQQIDLAIAQPRPNALGAAEEIVKKDPPGTTGNPRFLAIDTVGNLYVVRTYESSVSVYDADGKFLREWGQAGNRPGAVGSGFRLFIDQTTDNIYVSDTFNHRIQIFAPDGTLLRVVKSYDYGIVTDLAVAQDGSIFIATSLPPRILHLGQDGHLLQQWGNKASAAGQFNAPVSIAIDGNDELYVADYLNNRIQKFTLDGTAIITGASNFSPTVPLNKPLSIAIDKEFNVYVTELARVLKFDHFGRLLLQWGNVPGSASDQFYSVDDLAIYSNTVYVTDRLNNRIQRLNVSGGFQSPIEFGVPLNDTGINNPIKILFDKRSNIGNVFVLDNFGYLFQLNEDGKRINSWSLDIHKSGVPTNVATMDLAQYVDGSLLTVNVRESQIHQFLIEGDQLVEKHVWGSLGSGADQFSSPYGVEVDTGGQIYVADAGNRRIQVFQLSGDSLSLISSITSTQSMSEQQDWSPRRLTFDPQDNLWALYRIPSLDTYGLVKYAIDQNSNVTPLLVISDVQHFTVTFDLAFDASGLLYLPQRSWLTNQIGVYDQNGQIVYAFGDSGNGKGRFGSIQSLAFATDGSLWVGDTGRIQVLKPMSYTRPVAYVSQVSPSNSILREGDMLTMLGGGQVSDLSRHIVAYEWSSNRQGVLATQPSPNLSLPASSLEPGQHEIYLRVQDDGNNNVKEWSVPVVHRIYVARPKQNPVLPTKTATPTPTATSTLRPGETPPPTFTPTQTPTPTPACVHIWTMMLYLVGDYNDAGSLVSHYDELLHRLENVNAHCITIAVQEDGPLSLLPKAEPDTNRRLYVPGEVAQSFPISETEMDDPEKLIDFIQWAQTQAPADHYYLAIANHGQGSLGLGWDYTTDFNSDGLINNDKYLTNIEVGKALSDLRVSPIDILHLDACSMALFDVFYQMRYKVKYIVASQYLAWSFFAYDDFAQLIRIDTSAEDFAKAVVQRYAAHARESQVPFTLSALNVQRINELKDKLDTLAVMLKAWANIDSSGERIEYLYAIRQQQPTFDSNGDYLNDAKDNYVDLSSWASVLAQDQDARFNPDIRQVAQQVVELMQVDAGGASLLLANATGSQNLPSEYHGSWVELSHAHGLSVYYPFERRSSQNGVSAASAVGTPVYDQIYSDYLNNQLFDSTFAFRWDEFLAATLGTPAPDERLAPLPSPIAPANPPQKVYLPLIAK